jgi:hypothetical protein
MYVTVLFFLFPRDFFISSESYHIDKLSLSPFVTPPKSVPTAWGGAVDPLNALNHALMWILDLSSARSIRPLIRMMPTRIAARTTRTTRTNRISRVQRPCFIDCMHGCDYTGNISFECEARGLAIRPCCLAPPPQPSHVDCNC